MVGDCSVPNYSVDTYEADRHRFFGRLIAEPLFLLRHVPFLSRAILSRIQTRLRAATSDRQRGAKQWPAWLLRARNSPCTPVPPLRLFNLLPRYPSACPSVTIENDDRRSSRTDSQSDPEDSLADNRWGQLLHVPVGNERECSLAIECVEKWIACHTDTADAAWESYSACERLANSLVFYASIARTAVPSPLSDAYVDYLCRSVDWVYGHLEYYGDQRTNNHILNNARALVMGGAMLADQFALGAGMKIFQEFLPRMVTERGFLRERSSHYQLIVLNWVLDAWTFLRTSSKPEPQDIALLEHYALSMVTAAASLLNRDGQLCATIGDVSPDWTPRQALARLSVLYPDVWPPGRQAFPPCEVLDGWFRLSTVNGVVLGNFGEGVFPPPYPTHGHNDMTGFVWAEGGVTILTDPGRFRYTPDPLSLMQKSAASHNVPLVNGFAPFCETLLPNGQWWPQPYARATAAMTIEKNELLLSHDGFSRATPVKRHVRRLRLRDHVLEVIDSFEGEGDVTAELCWNFGGEYSVFDTENLVAKSKTNEVKVALSHSDTGQPVVHGRCKTVPLQESLSYGEVAPSLGLRLSLPLVLPTRIMTRFTISRCAA